MSFGGIIGGVVGGVAGFLVGGPAGAYIGAGVGLGIGMAVDPIAPDVSATGQPDTSELSITQATTGSPLLDLRGVTSTTGHHIWYTGNRTVAIKSEVSGGKGGGSEETTSGYEYYLTWAVALCQGPVDKLWAVYNGDDCVWAGELTRTSANEAAGEVIELCGIGSMRFYFGTETQTADPVMVANADDSTRVPAYRGTCYAVMNDCALGSSNRAPSLRFMIQKTPGVNGPTALTGVYDYNPAWAMYDVITDMVGMSADVINTSDFADTAETLYAEGMGISISFEQYQGAMTYIEAILTHIDALLLFNAEGQFTIKLLRADIESSELPVVTDADTLAAIELQRPSWLAMKNVIQVQYPRRYPISTCCDASLCDEAVPTLQNLYCDNVMCFDMVVDSIGDEGLTLFFATSLSMYTAVLTGGLVAFGTELKAISSADAGSITLTEAFTDDPTGESVAVATVQQLTDRSPAMGLFSVSDGNLPLSIQLADHDDGPWRSIRQVAGHNFAAECSTNGCIDKYMRVMDACDQASNCVLFPMSNDCSDMSFDYDDINLSECGGAPIFFSITGGYDNGHIGFSFGGIGHWDLINNRTCMWTPPSSDEPCCPGIAEVIALCCNAALGSAKIILMDNAKCPEISYTTTAMGVSEQQTLGIAGAVYSDCYTYSWNSIGGGTIEVAEGGLSAVYTAPESNANCDENAEIQLLVDGEVCDTLKIAINSAIGSAGKIFDHCEFYGTNKTGCWQRTFFCDGSIATDATLRSWFWDATSDCSSSCESLFPIDSRTATLKEEGCCPPQLL